MIKIKFFVLIIVSTMLLFVFLLRKNGSLPPTVLTSPSSSLSPTIPIFPFDTQTSQEGNIMVSVKPLVLTFNQSPQFEIIFDTHSEDLNFEVEKISVISFDQKPITASFTWEGSPPGGHHRKGVLTFSQAPSPNIKIITLTLKNISGTNRNFSWNIK